MYIMIINDLNSHDQICPGTYPTHLEYELLRLIVCYEKHDIKYGGGGFSHQWQISYIIIKCNIKCKIVSLFIQQDFV